MLTGPSAVAVTRSDMRKNLVASCGWASAQAGGVEYRLQRHESCPVRRRPLPQVGNLYLHLGAPVQEARFQAGAGLPAAASSAPAQQALGLHGHVADLAGQAQPAPKEVAVGDDARTDALSARQVEQIAYPGRRIAFVGGQCGELGVVLQRDDGDVPAGARAAGDSVANLVHQGDVVPSQGGGVAHGVIGVVDDPGVGQDDSRNRRPLPCQLVQGLGQHGRHVLDHPVGVASGVADELGAAQDERHVRDAHIGVSLGTLCLRASEDSLGPAPSAGIHPAAGTPVSSVGWLAELRSRPSA